MSELDWCYLPSIVEEYCRHHKYKSSDTKPCRDVNLRVITERRFTEYRPQKKTYRGDHRLKKKNSP